MLPEEIQMAIQKFRIKYGIEMDGVIIYLHPSTFHVCYNQFLHRLPLRVRIPLMLEKWWYERKGKPVTMDINWVPVHISTLLKKNEIMIVRKPEEVLIYESRDGTITGQPSASI